MAVIRAFRHEVKGHGTRHSTDVDCLYFDFVDTEGSRILQLSTLGSDQRQSQPKVSQTFQIGATGAAELRAILGRTFPASGSETVAEPSTAPRHDSLATSGPESTDPIDRFIARAHLVKVDDLSIEGSTAQRRVLARDDRPYAGGNWYLVDFTNEKTLTFADVERDLRSAPYAYQRAAVIVGDISADLEQFLVRSHADVVRLADLGLPRRERSLPSEVPHMSWIDELLQSGVYLEQKARAGRASIPDEVVRDVLDALSRIGGTGSIASVEREARLQPGGLRPMLPPLRRLLNIDGYDTLAVRDGGIVALEENLLEQQFGLVIRAVTEGDRP
ncbi:hypothetical protein [Cellulomonas sp. GbtcB1]|uniref:hypothetical protein n=1 Tax=Cellulomonas sp. GbtcB1 TaxID=2824746 RepID=UPI001C2FFF52|nr:hypothetical protein [Cellulomonas sp. GbtcB1]